MAFGSAGRSTAASVSSAASSARSVEPTAAARTVCATETPPRARIRPVSKRLRSASARVRSIGERRPDLTPALGEVSVHQRPLIGVLGGLEDRLGRVDGEERLLDVQFDVQELRVRGVRGGGHARVGRRCLGRDATEVEDLLSQPDSRQRRRVRPPARVAAGPRGCPSDSWQLDERIAQVGSGRVVGGPFQELRGETEERVVARTWHLGVRLLRPQPGQGGEHGGLVVARESQRLGQRDWSRPRQPRGRRDRQPAAWTLAAVGGAAAANPDPNSPKNPNSAADVRICLAIVASPLKQRPCPRGDRAGRGQPSWFPGKQPEIFPVPKEIVPLPDGDRGALTPTARRPTAC